MDRYTKDQIDELRDAFLMFDKNDTGCIPSNSLRDVLKTIGYNPTDKLLENMSIIIDEDSNGIIEFEEFVNLLDALDTEEKNEMEGEMIIYSLK